MNNYLNCKVVVGSWKAYNECNKRSLGSKWLDLSDYETLDEVYDELKNEGFTELELEETFVQDYEADIEFIENCDYTNIDLLWDRVQELDDIIEYLGENEVKAYLEEFGIKSLDDLRDLRSTELYLYADCDTLSDLAYELVQEGCYGEIPDSIVNYIDYEAMGRDLSFDGYYETSYGVLEVR